MDALPLFYYFYPKLDVLHNLRCAVEGVDPRFTRPTLEYPIVGQECLITGGGNYFKYAYARSYPELLKWLSSKPTEERNYHEILTNAHPNKMVIDIDLKLEELPQATEELMEKILKTWIVLVITSAEYLADEADRPPLDFDGTLVELCHCHQVIVTTSNRPGKFSYHIIFPAVVCERGEFDDMWSVDAKNRPETGAMDNARYLFKFAANRIAEAADGLPADMKAVYDKNRWLFADPAVYKKTQNLRMLGCSKPAVKVPKVFHTRPGGLTELDSFRGHVKSELVRYRITEGKRRFDAVYPPEPPKEEADSDVPSSLVQSIVDAIPNGENGAPSLTRRECSLVACNVGAYCRTSKGRMSLEAGEALVKRMLKRSPKYTTGRIVESVEWAYKQESWSFSLYYLRGLLKRADLAAYDRLFCDWKREEVIDLREDFKAALSAHGVDCATYSEPRCREFTWPIVWAANDKSTLFVRSPLGSGKSTQMRAMIDRLDPDARIVVLSFRVSFTLELQSTLHDFQRYDAVATDELRAAKRIIVQIDSLHRLGGARLPNYDLLLVDESESVFEQLLSDEMKHEVRGPNTAILTGLLKNTPRALFLDGNMSSRTVELVLQHRSTEFAAAHMNTYKSRAGTTIRYSFNRSVVDQELKKDLDAGRRIYIASSSKTAVNRLADWIKQTYPTKRVEVITSKTEQKRKVEFGLNYKTIIPTLDVLLVSPTITAGISFDDPAYFHRRYGYYDANHSKINHLTAVQQQYRVRNVADNSSIICFGGTAPVPYKVAHIPTDVAGLRAVLLERAVLKKIEYQLAFAIDDDGNKVYIEDLHFHSYLRKERLDTIARNNFAGNYLLLEKQAGCAIEALGGDWSEEAKEERKDLAADIKHAHDMMTWASAMQVVANTDVQEAEFHKLYDRHKNGLLTKDEQPRWLAGWLKAVYGVERLTAAFVEKYVEKPELVMFMLHNKMVGERRDGSIGYLPTKEILSMMKRDHIRKTAVVQLDVIYQDYDRTAYIAEFLHGYEVDLSRALSNGATIPADKMEAGNMQFLLRLEEKIADVNRLFGTKAIGKKDVKASDNKSVMAMLNALLKVVGLKIKAQRSNHRKDAKTVYNVERYFEYGQSGHPKLQPYFTRIHPDLADQVQSE